MARILVGAKEAVIGLETGKAHSYLVLEDDAGARSVTSLTDVRGEAFPPSLRFDVEQIGTPYDQAEETDDPNRVERPLDLGGRDAGAVWSLITQQAEAIRDEAPAYNPLTQNSNSFVASLLNVVGVDLERNLPGFDGRNPTDDPSPSDYPGLRNLLDFDYELVGTAAPDVIRGAGGDDRFSGEGGDDTLLGRRGSDTLAGGPGFDTFAWTEADEGLDTLVDFAPAADRLRLDTVVAGFGGGEEQLERFVRLVPENDGADGLLQVDADGPEAGAGLRDLALLRGQPGLDAQALYRVGDLLIDGQGPPRPFDPLAYVASYDDLVRAFGAGAEAGKRHYLTDGFAEGRAVSFDGLQYVATHGDLIEAFGPDRGAGTVHFIEHGLDEGRPRDGFDEAQYLANYPDLQAAFGTDLEAATVHYIVDGHREERTDEPLQVAQLDFLL
jgi:hypothetical protein